MLAFALNVSSVNTSRFQLCASDEQTTCVSLSDSTPTTQGASVQVTLSPLARGALLIAGIGSPASSPVLFLSTAAVTLVGGLEVPDLMLNADSVVPDSSAPRVRNVTATVNSTSTLFHIVLSEPAGVVQRAAIVVTWALGNGQVLLTDLSGAVLEIDSTLTQVSALTSRPAPDATPMTLIFSNASISDGAGNPIEAVSVTVQLHPATSPGLLDTATRGSSGSGSSESGIVVPVVIVVIVVVVLVVAAAVIIQRRRTLASHERVLQTLHDDMAWDTTIHRSDVDTTSLSFNQGVSQPALAADDTPTQL